MESSISSIAAVRKLRERHAFIYGAAIAGMAVATAAGGAWAYMDTRSAAEREERVATFKQGAINCEAQLKLEQVELGRLREEVKELSSEIAVLRERLSAAIDPQRRCGPLRDAVDRIQVGIAAKEARLPYERSPRVRTIGSNTPVNVFEEDDRYSHMLEDIQSDKLEMRKAEDDWRACVSHQSSK